MTSAVTGSPVTAVFVLCWNCRYAVPSYEEGVNDQTEQFIIDQFRIAQFRNGDMVCTMIQTHCRMEYGVAIQIHTMDMNIFKVDTALIDVVFRLLPKEGIGSQQENSRSISFGKVQKWK